MKSQNFINYMILILSSIYIILLFTYNRGFIPILFDLQLQSKFCSTEMSCHKHSPRKQTFWLNVITVAHALLHKLIKISNCSALFIFKFSGQAKHQQSAQQMNNILLTLGVINAVNSSKFSSVLL